MAMQDVQKFLKTLQKDEAAREALKKQPKPANDEEAVAAYVALAEKMGYSVTGEEMAAGLKGYEQIYQMMAAKAADGVKTALDEDALDHVAGGKLENCDSTAEPGEWCWFSDACSYIINGYDTAAPGGEAVTSAVPSSDYIDTEMDPATGDTIFTMTFDMCGSTVLEDLKNARKDNGLDF